jgi:serine/threonine protein kinase
MSQAAPQAPAQRRQLSIPDFWQLILNAQLMTPEHVQALQGQFGQMKGANNGNAATLAEWLIAQRQLSRFQAKVLLSGQPGPFVFGQYRVYDRVESGRLTTMFRAVHVATGHPVLLTFLSGPNAQNLERLQKAAKRAAINSGIHHPHVVRCLHFADLRAYKYLVLEDLHGQTLEELLAAKGPIAPSEACRIARQAALGLMRLEELKLVHGDLRPANIWINHLGTVKIIDFPMSRDPLADAVPFDANTAANPARQPCRRIISRPRSPAAGSSPTCGPISTVWAASCIRC